MKKSQIIAENKNQFALIKWVVTTHKYNVVPTNNIQLDHNEKLITGKAYRVLFNKNRSKWYFEECFFYRKQSEEILNQH